MTRDARLIKEEREHDPGESTVIENLSGELRNPGAIAATMAGQKQRRNTDKTNNNNDKGNVMRTRREASSSPCFCLYSVRTGMKAEDMILQQKAPQKIWDSERREEGVRKTGSAKIDSKDHILYIARTRLIKVATDIRPAAFAIFPLPSISALIIANEPIFQS